MVLSLYVPALVAAFLIVTVEMTEVVALVVALSADAGSARHGSLGAVVGAALVGGVAVGFSAALLAVPHAWLLIGSAVVLAAFTVFLFRSTLRSYRRARVRAAGGPGPPPRPALLFAGGFAVGATEASEAVVVLIALSAGGYALEAVVGSVAAVVLLIVLALWVHERIRRIKVPWLKLGATSLIFAFATFWGGEALGVQWPFSDLFIVPLFVLGLVVVRGGVALGVRGPLPVDG
jgi:Ca2+/H+ antiporter, TMEM165/GDT1 family